MNRPQSKRVLQRIVDDFNQQYQIGAAVRLRKDKETVTTKVRGKAVVLEGHSAVAWFEGIPGCYSIEGECVSRATQLSEASQ